MIAKSNFKINKLEELATILNIQINLKYYNHDDDYKQTSKHRKFH